LLEKISHGENDIKELFENIDVLVDGKFIVSERISEEVHPYRGSNNQRLIDVKKSLAEHSIHLFNIT
jgi:anaerobic ribonucleoside-triphosphate reductase activating protein